MSKQVETIVGPMVITAGDEGVQLNQGQRLGIVGSGYQLPHFEKIVKVLKKLYAKSGLVLTSVQEDDWLAEKLDSRNPNLYQETLESLAVKVGVEYVGQLDYGDPRDLDDGVTRGHLVRPQKIHVADRIVFTTGGGEQIYNLRKIVVSADFLFGLSEKEANEVIRTQIDFYQALLKKKLKFEVETEGDLEEKKQQVNQEILEKILGEYQ